jgi:hypothetical protein
VNRDNHVIYNLSFFENVVSFCITLVRIRKKLCTKAACRIVVVGEFLVFELVFTIFPVPD